MDVVAPVPKVGLCIIIIFVFLLRDYFLVCYKYFKKVAGRLRLWMPGWSWLGTAQCGFLTLAEQRAMGGQGRTCGLFFARRCGHLRLSGHGQGSNILLLSAPQCSEEYCKQLLSAPQCGCGCGGGHKERSTRRDWLRVWLDPVESV